eukprot:scaffold27884_cov65-Phaeocystis_antarctica.AAC.3
MPSLLSSSVISPSPSRSAATACARTCDVINCAMLPRIACRVQSRVQRSPVHVQRRRVATRGTGPRHGTRDERTHTRASSTHTACSCADVIQPTCSAPAAHMRTRHGQGGQERRGKEEGVVRTEEGREGAAQVPSRRDASAELARCGGRAGEKKERAERCRPGAGRVRKSGAQEARTSSAQAAEHRCSDDRPLQLSQQPAGGRAASRAHCALAAVAFRQVERARDEALQPVLPNIVRLLLKLLVKLGRRGAAAGRWDLLQLGWREAGRHHRGKAQQHAARGLREEHHGEGGGVSSQHLRLKSSLAHPTSWSTWAITR